ncbi:uncharacterized protein LOC116249233 isoform X1 [Nymphaea colorata]|nr:uncharacterized protein LOC116249233 isoform X1 [Nymphaea colorata]
MRSSERAGAESPQVLAIECVKGSTKGEEWNGALLQTGDIVEEVHVAGSMVGCAPFKGGRGGVQKLLRASYKRNETSISVRARRGRNEFVEMQGCIVPNEAAGRKQYIIRSVDDPNYAVAFVDRTESECFEIQGTKSSRVVSALYSAQLKDGYVSYPWEKMMREFLPIPNSSCFLSMLVLPCAPDNTSSQYNDLNDTLARANAWLVAAQASGVPIAFMNVQTEPILTKISGDCASSSVNAGSLSELSNVTTAGVYGFEDYHGVDIGVVRSVRLWYAPIAGEFPVEVELKDEDSRLGFSISRTEEGFIYISSVTDGDGDHESASQRSGLNALYKSATEASKLLIVSRVSNEKVLPWMVSSDGALRCFDTVSLSHKLSLHRHALKPILMHVFLWDRVSVGRPGPNAKQPSIPPTAAAKAPTKSPALPGRSDVAQVASSEQGGTRLSKDAAGEFSFRMEDPPSVRQ